MHKLPLAFISEAFANGQFEDSWPINSGRQKTECSIPNEFGGNGGAFSPEDFFLQATIDKFS